MITVFSLIKRRPNAHVSPSKKSRAMAPRAHDLMEEVEKVNQGKVHLTVCFLYHKFVFLEQQPFVLRYVTLT